MKRWFFKVAFAWWIFCGGATWVGAESARLEEAERLAKQGTELRIVGGADISIAERPWQVSLVLASYDDDFWAHFCGGTLIDPHWVLTAAHCVDDGTAASDIQVLVGTDQLDGSGDRFGIRKILIHKNWDKDSKRNDIALLELRDRISRQPTIGLASSAQLEAASVARVSGWGRTRELGQRVASLQGVELEIQSLATCNGPEAYNGAVTDNMMCAGRSGGGQDSCQGDSGGPATVFSAGNTLLAGIVSWGTGCARPKKYGVYTRVPAYLDWIARTVADGGSPEDDAGLSADMVINPEARSVAADMVLHCEVSCGRTPTRAGVARITWTMPERGLRAAGVEPAALSRPTLDASVFKGRFIPDNFAVFPSMRPQAGALTARSTDSSRVAGAYDLRVTDFSQATSDERALGAGPDAEDVVVVEGLAPGMIYTWRLRFPVDGGFVESAMVSCQAPVCPMDFRKEKKP